MTERWRDVVGYEGMYDISTHGRLRSYLRQRMRPMTQPAVLKPYVPKRTGYPMYLLSKGGQEKWRTAHSLVLESFVGPRPDGLECCHNDGDRRNAKLDNLRYDTRTANVRDCLKHGTLRTRANGHQWTKIPLSEIARIVDGDEPATVLAKEYGVGYSAISSIRKRSGKWTKVGRVLRRRDAFEARLALGEAVNL